MRSRYYPFPLYSEVQAFGLARLLICVQIIVLFQRKDERLYWLLVMLSLLQVVVATLFSQGVWFGFLLTAYMMLGFSAMTLLLLFRQWGQGTAGPACRAGLAAAGSSRQQGPDPAGGTCRRPPPPRRRPSAARPAEFVSFPSGSDRAGLGRDLFRRLTHAMAYTLALTAVLFFALPRLAARAGGLAQGAEPSANAGRLFRQGEPGRDGRNRRQPRSGHARMVFRLLYQ